MFKDITKHPLSSSTMKHCHAESPCQRAGFKERVVLGRDNTMISTYQFPVCNSVQRLPSIKARAQL